MAFSIVKRFQSFPHAFRGLKFLVVSQHNAWIHSAATILVVILGCIFRVSRSDWLWLILAIALVWIAESLNTALETLADEVSQEYRARLGHAKDLGAAAVLLAATAAAFIGFVVFLHHF